jgi:hypothetical protein
MHCVSLTRYPRETLGEALGRLQEPSLQFEPSVIFAIVDRDGEHA